MRKNLHRAVLLLFFFSALGPANVSQAGQVVTDSLKSWARDALRQEKDTVTQVVPNSIAVFYFQNQTGRPDIDLLQKGLSVMLARDLATIKGIKVIERAKIQALAEEMGLGASGTASPAEMRRMANLLGAFYSVQGVISKGLITDLKIKTDLMEIPDDMLLDQPVSAGDLADITSMEKEILFDIVATLQVQLSAARQKTLEKPLSTDMDALFLLFQAIDASDRGKYETAEDLYRRAVHQDPQLSMATAAIDELQKGVLAAKKPPVATANVPPATAPSNRQPPPTAEKLAPRPPAQPVAPGGEIPADRGASEQPAAAPAATTPESAPTTATGITAPAKSGTQPPTEKGTQHMSSAKIIAIGVGIAAIGALALAGGGGGGGGGGEATSPPSQPPAGTPAAPAVTSSDPPAGAAVSCASGVVKFVFSKVMDINAGRVQVSPTGWKFTAGFGTDNRILTVFWDNNCPGAGETLPGSITFSLQNFQDTSQTPLVGTTVFTFAPTM